MINSNGQAILAAIKGGLTGEKVVLSESLDAEYVCRLAKQHQICGMLLYGLMSAGLSSDSAVCKRLFGGAIAETVLHEQQTVVLGEMFSALEAEKIPYMPLKGTLLKELYPKPEFRVMSDADILIKDEDHTKIFEIMRSCGFEQKYESDHEIVWKKGAVAVELHKHLIPSYNDDYHEYFTNVWNKAVNVSGSRYRLEDNDEFVFVFTHFAKHYRDGGIGIKHFTDLWLMLQKHCVDEAYVREELSKMHLDKFYDNVKSTLGYVFEGAEESEATQIIINTILESGAYGSADDRLTARVTLNAKRGNSRFAAVVAMIFPSRSVLAPRYKYLEKAAILLPVAWISRWANALFVQRNRLARGAEYMRVARSDATLKHTESLSKVGIEYNLKKGD